MESPNSDCDYFNESFPWTDYNQWSHVRKANMAYIWIQFSPLRCPTFLPLFAHLRAPMPTGSILPQLINVAFENLFLLSLLTHSHFHQHPTLTKSLPYSFHLLLHRGYRAYSRKPGLPASWGVNTGLSEGLQIPSYALHCLIGAFALARGGLWY